MIAFAAGGPHAPADLPRPLCDIRGAACGAAREILAARAAQCHQSRITLSDCHSSRRAVCSRLGGTLGPNPSLPPARRAP